MRHFAAAACLVLVAATLSAATFDLPSDRQLLDRADLVVVATVLGATPRAASDGMILTDHRLLVEEVLKGQAAETIVVSEAGGFLNGRGVDIAGSATYAPNTRVLAFLRQRPDGTYYTAYMSLGKYRFARGLLVRETSGIETIDGEPDEARDAEVFLRDLRAGVPSPESRIAAPISATDRPEPAPATNAAASAYVLTGNGLKRWKDCETGCSINFILNNGSQAVSNPVGGLEAAYAAWTNHTNSFVSLGSAGFGGDTGQTNDDENDIVFMWDGSNPHFACEAAKGCGIVYFNGFTPGAFHTFRGEDFSNVVAADVLISSAVTNQTSYESILTHELGHALAFRHSDEGTPFSTAGVMRSTVPTGVGANLGPWESDALTAVYGPGLPCVPVTINSVAGGGVVPSGQTATLTVNASGDTPRTHQWYQGTTGVTTTPVGTNSSSFTTPAITETRQYWVRVSNSCTPDGVNSATITVTPESCDQPAISTHTQSKSISAGQTTTLNVTASGTAPLTFRWYRSNTVGDTTNQVGTQANFTTPALNTTTSYWARVSNNCGQADTALITITVAGCPAITAQSQSQSVNSGQTAALSVSATGTAPLTFRWYRSNTVGDTTNQVGTQASFTTPALTVTTSYWARVSNSCGHADTTLITITVGNACPTIVSQSPNLTLEAGQGATISVLASGNAPLSYQWYQGDSPSEANPIAGATNASFDTGALATGTYRYWAKVTNTCGNAKSATIVITVGCPSILIPLASVPSNSHFSNGYDVSWTGNASASTFEVQEATDIAFTQNLKTFAVSGVLHKSIPAHLEIATDTRFYYRVRGLSVCTGQPTDWSMKVSIVVTRPMPATSEQFAFSVPLGNTQGFTQDLLVPGFGETANVNDRFDITIDVPWITVFPATGALSAGGTTVQLTINPTGLEVGSTTGTILIVRTPGAAAGGIATHGAPVTIPIPLGLSLVTPVSPAPRDGNPPPGTMIVPAVAHAQGIGSPFRSDVRIANVSFSSIDYEISFTPSGNDGTQTGKKTRVTVTSGDVLALDDLVSSWFGAGMLGEGGLGTIEIRPLNAASEFDTFASSRTYALDGGGTLGQFIPALRLNQFVGNIAQDSLARISLQQVANSSAYRTNVGFVEGSGAPVDFVARLVGSNGNVIGTIVRSLPPYGQTQTNLTALFGNVALPDGRVEVEVTSAGGKVSAYASVLNNLTNDPLMVFPVQPARTTAERYVLAGIAEFESGSRNFHSDMRVYNGGNSPVTATFWYYDRGASTPFAGAPPAQRTLQPGQIIAIDNVLPTLWPGIIGGGSVFVTTPPGSSLVVTAQTYSREPDGGTKGQFIPGVTFREAVGFGDRALEVLQLEQSAQYRSNVGFVEVTGAPATIEVTAYEPDAKTSRVTSIPLQANEYRQFDRILEQMGLGTVYNGRVSVKVITGAGRVYAYGSIIDNRTEDPTYVPAQ